MSKLDILNEGREQGIHFAYKIVKSAQAEGKDPKKALDRELSFRKRTNIRTLCEEQGITLAEVMEKAGYNVNHLHHLACKHLPPTEEAVRCYAKALGVKPERLMEGMFT